MRKNVYHLISVTTPLRCHKSAENTNYIHSVEQLSQYAAFVLKTMVLCISRRGSDIFFKLKVINVWKLINYAILITAAFLILYFFYWSRQAAFNNGAFPDWVLFSTLRLHSHTTFPNRSEVIQCVFPLQHFILKELQGGSTFQIGTCRKNEFWWPLMTSFLFDFMWTHTWPECSWKANELFLLL